jgi:4-hydroxythreonine-4-phosphate dehydrogenase
LSKLKKIAISVGDLNGISSEILIRAHERISKICQPIYCVNRDLLDQCSQLLSLPLPDDLHCSELEGTFTIKPGETTQESGDYSFKSFYEAISLAESGEVSAIVTLPINKEAWSLAGLEHKGHTDYLRKHFDQEAIMMLGCEELYVALYSEHIPLRDVIDSLDSKTLENFLINFYHATSFENVGVLGVNPHAGDGGVLGDEESIIVEAIQAANSKLHRDIFHGPLVSDTAFTPHALQACNRIVAMYHDQGLAPLKALYFDKSINVSLHLPIKRSSVDHGTAFDIAFKGKEPKTISYINAITQAIQ